MSPRKTGFFSLPATRVGRWSGGLILGFVVLFTVNPLLVLPRWGIVPAYGVSMIGCGVLAGAVGLTALIRERERSWLVWFAAVIGMALLVFVTWAAIVRPSM